MIIPSHSSSVPLFHSLGNGTVEQAQAFGNTQGNASGTNSLKALANKVLERNKERKTYGTRVLKPVPPPGQLVPLRGTNAEIGCKGEADKFLYEFNGTDRLDPKTNVSVMSVPAPSTFDKDSLLYEFEERLSIADSDGYQPSVQAQKIAYLDAFISLLSDLAEDDPHQDWLAQQIQTALSILEAQNFPTLN